VGRGGGWDGREGKGEEGGREGEGEGRGGERGQDVEGPGKWFAPGPVLALGGPGCCIANFIKIGSRVRPPDAHNY